MKHICDFKNYRWFQLETIEEAQEDHKETGINGAFPYWALTNNGSKFFVLRDENDKTYMTTVFYGGHPEKNESKVSLGEEPDFHYNALKALVHPHDLDSKEIYIIGETKSEERKQADAAREAEFRL